MESPTSITSTEDAPGESVYLPEDFRDGLAPRDSDIFILLIGPAGSGKTTFISHCTDNKDFTHNESSVKGFSRPPKLADAEGKFKSTEVPKVYRCEADPFTNIYLIDTPGFGHQIRTDAETLHEISDFLTKAYWSIPIHGVLYFHAVVDSELHNNAFRYMDIFREICGGNALKNATFVTTKWDQTSVTGDDEEDLGRVGFWAQVIGRTSGQGYYRNATNSKESAMKLLERLRDSQPEPVLLQLQQEIILEHHSLAETSAGEELSKYLRSRIMKSNAEIAALKESLSGKHPQRHLPGTTDAILTTRIAIEGMKADIEECNSEMGILASDPGTLFSRLLWREREGREIDDGDKQRIINGLYSRIAILAKHDITHGNQPVSSVDDPLEYLRRQADIRSFSFNSCETLITFMEFLARMAEWDSLISSRALPQSSPGRYQSSLSSDSNMSPGDKRPSDAGGEAETREPAQSQTGEDLVGRKFLPIHHAIWSGNLETVKQFLSERSPEEIFAQNKYGYTPLALALIDGAGDIASTIAYHYMPGFTIADKFAFKEILNSYFDTLSKYLSLCTKDEKFWALRTEDGGTLLHVAMELDAARAHLCFSALQSAPTDVLNDLLAHTDIYGLTAIARAASNGRRANILGFAQIFKSRVRIREVVNKESRFGSPFFLAATRGHIECAQALLSLGANRSRLELCGLSTRDWIGCCTGTVIEEKKTVLDGMTGRTNYKMAATLAFDSTDKSQPVTERARRYLLEKDYNELLSDPTLLCHLSQHYFNLSGRMLIVRAGGTRDPRSLLQIAGVENGIILYALYLYTLRKKFGFSVILCGSCSSPIGNQFYHCLMCPLADFCEECFNSRSTSITQGWGSRRQNCNCLPYHPWAKIDMASFAFSSRGDITDKLTVDKLFHRLRYQEAPPVREPYQ